MSLVPALDAALDRYRGRRGIMRVATGLSAVLAAQGGEPVSSTVVPAQGIRQTLWEGFEGRWFPDLCRLDEDKLAPRTRWVRHLQCTGGPRNPEDVVAAHDKVLALQEVQRRVSWTPYVGSALILLATAAFIKKLRPHEVMRLAADILRKAMDREEITAEALAAFTAAVEEFKEAEELLQGLDEIGTQEVLAQMAADIPTEPTGAVPAPSAPSAPGRDLKLLELVDAMNRHLLSPAAVSDPVGDDNKPSKHFGETWAQSPDLQRVWREVRGRVLVVHKDAVATHRPPDKSHTHEEQAAVEAHLTRMAAGLRAKKRPERPPDLPKRLGPIQDGLVLSFLNSKDNNTVLKHAISQS